MNSRHFVPSYMASPTDPISITVVGCGGTGSRLIYELARLNLILLKLDHVGLSVTVVDFDKVSSHNVGKQLFYESDVGKYKAEVITDRIRYNLGFDWKADTRPVEDLTRTFRMDTAITQLDHNIVVTCVDRVDPRLEVLKYLIESVKRKKGWWHDANRIAYHIDCGNSYDEGQVICGTIKNIKQPKMDFKTVGSLKGFQQFFGLDKINEAHATEDNIGSCSTYEAIHRQDPFINVEVANHAARIIWKLIKDHWIEEHGYFINLKNTSVSSLPVR